MAEATTVTVDATWRLARVEISTPYDMRGMISGQGEILLSDAGQGTSAPFLARPRMVEEGPRTIGTVRGAFITRPLDTVLEETVDYNGTTFTLVDVNEILSLFFQKWRTEDDNKPVPDPLMARPVDQPAAAVPPGVVPQRQPPAPAPDKS